MTCGLYYKHVTIINYASSGINKLKASLNDNARVVIYDRHMFIVQATGVIEVVTGRNRLPSSDRPSQGILTEGA
jgi:hypothetical protein